MVLFSPHLWLLCLFRPLFTQHTVFSCSLAIVSDLTTCWLRFVVAELFCDAVATLPPPTAHRPLATHWPTPTCNQLMTSFGACDVMEFRHESLFFSPILLYFLFARLTA